MESPPARRSAPDHPRPPPAAHRAGPAWRPSVLDDTAAESLPEEQFPLPPFCYKLTRRELHVRGCVRVHRHLPHRGTLSQRTCSAARGDAPRIPSPQLPLHSQDPQPGAGARERGRTLGSRRVLPLRALPQGPKFVHVLCRSAEAGWAGFEPESGKRRNRHPEPDCSKKSKFGYYSSPRGKSYLLQIFDTGTSPIINKNNQTISLPSWGFKKSSSAIHEHYNLFFPLVLGYVTVNDLFSVCVCP
ncbi:uncharacterized protein LOC116995624 [Catharus ustulatus]|uniref:uncharacterized protein LOC116995624 n=1 Tax=Catharus ustulatus TaxID=91951 RepID=UPI0014078B04|nr:uncharacterized protein LOC116995624 [Catharus ustulatus]